MLLSATSRGAPVAWQWDTTTPDLFPDVDLATGGSIRLAVTRDQLRLSNAKWATVVQAARDATLTGAAMVSDHDRIYVATYNRIATGCTLTAFATSNGAKLWSVALEGAGPIAHSKYSNRVQLREIDGKPVVFGEESGARYVEVRDPVSGVLASNVKLAAQWIDRPIAELLFAEIAHELASHATYQVSVDDFLARTLRMKGVDPTERGIAFRQAVSSLQHVALQHGRFELQLELIERSGDFVVKAKRVAHVQP
ncbi:MAG: hypothetical protein ABI467_15580 [Kofleriaceae bacterium]